MPLPMTTTTTTMQLKRPTPSTLEEWETFSTVNDDKAQIRLARAMGYPPSWRVVRSLIQVPIPEDLAKPIPAQFVLSLIQYNLDEVRRRRMQIAVHGRPLPVCGRMSSH